MTWADKPLPAVKVRCSICGKALKGFPASNGGFAVRAHLDDTDRRCEGRWRTDHQLRDQKKVA